MLEDLVARSGLDLWTVACAGPALIGLLAAISLWQLVGIWRRATKSSRKSGRRFWPRVVEIYREFGIADWAVETAGRQQFWTPPLDQMIPMDLCDPIYDPASTRFAPAAGYCMAHPAQCGEFDTPARSSSGPSRPVAPSASIRTSLIRDHIG